MGEITLPTIFWLPEVLALGQLSKNSGHFKACCCLPAARKAQQVKMSHAVHELNEAGVSGSYQCLARCVHHVNAYSGLVPVLNLRPFTKRLRAH